MTVLKEIREQGLQKTEWFSPVWPKHNRSTNTLAFSNIQIHCGSESFAI